MWNARLERAARQMRAYYAEDPARPAPTPRAPRRKANYTVLCVAEFRRLYADPAISFREIAARFGHQPSWVCQVVKQLKLTPRCPRWSTEHIRSYGPQYVTTSQVLDNYAAICGE